jgi:hypothetical protein
VVEELLAARGIIVSHETVRQWALKFGQPFANQIRRRLPRVGDKWHLDEVALKIAGVKHWLWWVVDQTGIVLDVLVQRQRNTRAQAAAAQAAEEADAAATRHDYRQACQLRCGEEGDHARHRASAVEGIGQQSGEFAPADATTRVANEAVQICQPGPALPLSPRSDQQPVSFRRDHVTGAEYRACQDAGIMGLGGNQQPRRYDINRHPINRPTSPGRVKPGDPRPNKLTVPPEPRWRRPLQDKKLLAEKCHLGFASRMRSEQSDEQSP